MIVMLVYKVEEVITDKVRERSQLLSNIQILIVNIVVN